MADSRAEKLRRWLRTRCSVDISAEDAQRVADAQARARKAMKRSRVLAQRWRQAERARREVNGILEKARRALERVSRR